MSFNRKPFINLILIATLAMQSLLSHACFMSEQGSAAQNAAARNTAYPSERIHAGHNMLHDQHQHFHKQDDKQLSATNSYSMHMHTDKMSCCQHAGDCSMDGCGLHVSTIPAIVLVPVSYARFQLIAAASFSVSNPPIETLYHPPIMR